MVFSEFYLNLDKPNTEEDIPLDILATLNKSFKPIIYLVGMTDIIFVLLKT